MGFSLCHGPPGAASSPLTDESGRPHRLNYKSEIHATLLPHICSTQRTSGTILPHTCSTQRTSGTILPHTSVTSHGEMQSMDVSMYDRDELPSVESFVSILQNCRDNKSLVNANHALLWIHYNGFEVSCALGNYVVPLLVVCGGYSVAQQSFRRLAFPNEHSWTSLIQGHIECGEYQQALDLYEKMQEDNVPPSKHTFVALLKACSRLKYVERGCNFFNELVKLGYEKEPFVSNILVDLYAKCDLLVEAQGVFEEVSAQSVVSWTSLISGYVEQGLAEEAVCCFEEMREQGVSPNAVTFICVLKACTNMGIAQRGQEVHSIIIEEGFEDNLMVGNSLVGMYASHSKIMEAQDVFDNMPTRDVITWSALMAGYTEHQLEEDALNLLEQMQLEGIFPNVVTYVCALQACSSMGAVEKAQYIHTMIIEGGLETDPLIGSTLVDAFAGFGLLVDAEDVFRELSKRDIVAWTAMIAGYVENGRGEKVLSCLEEMGCEGYSLDTFTMACSLRACSDLGVMERGQELHLEVVTEAFDEDPFVGNSLVSMYAKCGWMIEAQECFNMLPVKDVVSCNALITGYIELGCSEEAFECLEMMELNSVMADSITIVTSLKACANVRALVKGQEIHAEAAKDGLESDQLVGSLLVALYGRCGKFMEALETFNELLVRDIISWTGLITGYADYGFTDEALGLLKDMQADGITPDMIAWSAVIAGFNKHEDFQSVWKLYAQMQEQGVMPNMVTLVSILKACGQTAALERGRKAHSLIHGCGLEDLTITAALADMYSKCGSMVEVQKLFDTVPTRNTFKWNALITGMAREGESELVFHMVDGMQRAGIRPNGITFLNTLSVCSHGGFLDKGLEYFEVMTEGYGITPSFKHVSCMIDLLCRAGQLSEAVVMLQTMPFQLDLAMWNTMLAACWKWKNVDVGKKAFEGATSSATSGDKRIAAAFTMMSNIYTDAGMVEDAKKIDAMILRM